jgi:Barstar (barnase inhibitor)
VRALRPGVRAAGRPAAEVVADAERRGAVAHLVAPAASKAELLEEFARALTFPAWVGRNWDALADALGDLSWLPAGPHVVVWVGWTALQEAQPAEYAIALDVLRHATSASAGTSRPLTVLLVPE